ncbi:hypothetical protein DL89DRAFT_21143 [Linderina pennispora]|uniref:Uncharacterized protein n=1 Tax=Linderina pennispora TaxID=61395 RepID=A0A1Y1WN84_9FUNG|nr:uncharacterized protein DL89DRAFT_21143 [Linderina pennispora]ORX74676.1 hypothetical protein DL89DRAFT_21143 [Linderina pennispora]
MTASPNRSSSSTAASKSSHSWTEQRRNTSTVLELASTSSDAKGTATISGASVTQLSLDLSLGSQFNQGKPTTVYLKKSETLPLRQAQEARSYIKSALRKTADGQFDTVDEALGFFERVLDHVQRARATLALGSQQGLQPLQWENTDKFAPPLPENLVIECGLMGSVFAVHAYWLKFRRTVKNSGGILDAFKKDPTTGHMLVVNGRLAEVRREVVFEAAFAQIQEGLATLDLVAGVCIDVVGQLHSFDSM